MDQFENQLEELLESIIIEQENNKYLLTIKNISNMIVLIISSLKELYNITYSRKLSLKEIK